MLEELHELLGGAAVACLGTTVAIGAAVYLYPRIRTRVPAPHRLLVRIHRWGALGFLALMASHYLTAPRHHPLQPAGALGLVAVFGLGWVLRLDKRHYRLLVQAKAALVVIGAIALLAGHALLDDERRGESAVHSDARVQWAVPVPAARCFPPEVARAGTRNPERRLATG